MSTNNTNSASPQVLLSALNQISFDAAAIGNLPRYAKTVEDAIKVARVDAAFSSQASPVLSNLVRAIDLVPARAIPRALLLQIEELREIVVRFLGGSRQLTRTDILTEQALVLLMGSSKNVGVLPRRNVRLLVEFFEKNRVENSDVKKWVELMRGIDLHAVDPVAIVELKAGDIVLEYVDTSRPADRQIGQWLVLGQGAVSHRNLGLSAGATTVTGEQRVAKRFRVLHNVNALLSKAAPAIDTWTTNGLRTSKVIRFDDGKLTMKAGEAVAGGGDQYFLPEAWKHLVPVTP
ncbi:MAG TPA: hypothetical protein VGM82_15095 [Gemmatimonadaceae bacterium]|jgi:hypothetical protein